MQAPSKILFEGLLKKMQTVEERLSADNYRGGMHTVIYLDLWRKV